MTSQVSVLPPSCVVTVIVAVPTPIAVTSPFSSTVATPVLLLSQVTFLLLALSGFTVAVRVSLLPTVRVSALLFRVTFCTGTTAGLTVTSQVSVLPPSCVVTVIVAVPTPIAVTSPFSSTVATPVLLLSQVTFLLLALSGFTVAVRVSLPPTVRESTVLSRVTLVTRIFSTILPLVSCIISSTTYSRTSSVNLPPLMVSVAVAVASFLSG